MLKQFVSKIDHILHQFRKQQSPSVSQQTERDKHEDIAQRRDYPTECTTKPSDTLFDD